MLGVVAAGDHGEREGQHPQQPRVVTGHAGGDEVRDGVVARLASTPLDELGEVGHQLADRIGHLVVRRGGVRRDDRVGPCVEASPVLLRHAEVVGDDHARQRLEQVGHDVAAAGREQPIEPFHHERSHRRLDGLDLPRREPPRDEPPELGVNGRVGHHHRRVVGKADPLQLAVLGGQPLRRRERLVVAHGIEDVAVPGEHPVVTVLHMVHRVVLAQCGVHLERVAPGLTRARHVTRVRHIDRHVSTLRQRRRAVKCAQETDTTLADSSNLTVTVLAAPAAVLVQ